MSGYIGYNPGSSFPEKERNHNVYYGVFEAPASQITLPNRYRVGTITVYINGIILNENEFLQNGLVVDLGIEFEEGTVWRVEENAPLSADIQQQFQRNSEEDRNRSNHTGTQVASTISDPENISGYVNAADYGFSVSASAAQNASALLDAVATGSQVVIRADSDFFMDSVGFTDQPVSITFLGNGCVDRTTPAGSVLTYTSNYTNIQEVLSISFRNVTINGSNNNTASTSRQRVAVEVANPTVYSRGDVVKVVSDDIDPDASTSGARRRGEHAVVAYVDDTYVYLAQNLEDFGLYVTNIRLVKQADYKFQVHGLKVKSNYSYEGQLFSVRGAQRPVFEYTAFNHGGIVANTTSCYQGKFYPTGTGQGTISGSLGYLFNDNGGWGNRIIRPHGKFFRHVTTTNFATSSTNDDPMLYGACRDHKVEHGVAESAQGNSWDDHEGARRTVWAFCETKGMIENGSTGRCAYNIRGVDSQVIHPVVDDSCHELLSLSVATPNGATVTVTGGHIQCPVISVSTSITQAYTIILNECYVDQKGDYSTFFLNGQGNVIINGGVYRRDVPFNARRIIEINKGCAVHLNDPRFVFNLTSSVTFLRPLFYAATTDNGALASITGNLTFEHNGVDADYTGLAVSATTDNSALLAVKVKILGENISVLAGTTGGGNYSDAAVVSRSLTDGTSNSVNVPDFATYLTKLGAI